MKKLMLCVLLVLALFALGACGKEEAPAVTAAPTAEATEAPTAEPTEAPAAEPTEAPDAEAAEAPAAETAEEVIGGADAETGIAVAAETAEEDAVLASAYDGAVTVMRSDVEEEFDMMLASYIAYYAQYGQQIDEYDQNFQASVAQETVQMKLSQRIVAHYAETKGYVLDDAKMEQLQAEVNTVLDNMREYYESYLSYYGYEGEDLDKIVEEELTAGGFDQETLMESAQLKDVLDYIFNIATEGVTVTDEEVRASFDAKVETQKAGYAENPDAFINDYLGSENEVLYTPENMRLLHCIFIELEDEEAAEATASEATADEATASEATPAEAVNPADLKGLAKAEAVVAEIRAGRNFDEAMIAYNEDASTEEQMMKGYPMTEGGMLYGEEFAAGAMALEKVGDVSDVIVTDYGYFIISYAADLTSGVVDFEPRKEAETEEALMNKKNTVYSEYLDTVMEEADVVVNDLSPLYHIYVADVVEATVAYATVSEDQTLTDMPEGSAVAALKAGASLDVLGRIGMDGEEYAFVAVPGTEVKGYINAKVISDLDAEAALKVDNTQLMTKAEPVDKLPTFTIVMNDGSLIYGELYPDVAPETVGNFVTLSNTHFYDNLTFHRVVPGFMIQGGDPQGNGMGGPGYSIRGEFKNNGVTNDLSHTRGVLSMARSSAMDSAGSQFFIMHADNDYLDGDYAGFGLVLGGIETVDLIASVPTNGADKPMTDQVMRTVYVETYGKEYTFTKMED